MSRFATTSSRYPSPYKAPRYQPADVDVIDLLAAVLRDTQPLKGAACADPAVAHLFDDDAGEDAHGRAIATCADCLVLERCRAYAGGAPAGTVSGVLGGTVIPGPRVSKSRRALVKVGSGQ